MSHTILFSRKFSRERSIYDTFARAKNLRELRIGGKTSASERNYSIILITHFGPKINVMLKNSTKLYLTKRSSPAWGGVLSRNQRCVYKGGGSIGARRGTACTRPSSFAGYYILLIFARRARQTFQIHDGVLLHGALIEAERAAHRREARTRAYTRGGEGDSRGRRGRTHAEFFSLPCLFPPLYLASPRFSAPRRYRESAVCSSRKKRGNARQHGTSFVRRA